MVGVPGRSRGCHTCRRRKKGCDKNVPSCHQCIKHGLVCEGYERELVWINASHQHEDQSKSVIRRHEETSRHQRPPWLSMYTKGAGGANVNITISDALLLTAREQKYLGIFWNDYFPNGRAFSDQACMLSTGGWTRAVNRLHGSEPLLHKAMVALSASVLGTQNDDTQLRLKGLQTYCSATVDMLTAVKHQRLSRSDGVLAAVRLLEFYEVLFGFGAEEGTVNSNLSSWLRHNDGQLGLILFRGPHSFQQGLAHTLFADARYNTALSHITRRRKCPLSHPDWLAIPWMYCKKTIKDRLVDILVQLPGLLENIDALRDAASIAAVDEQRKRVIQQGTQLRKALRVWEGEIGSELTMFDYTVSAMPLKPPSTDRQVSLLHLSTVYWAICLGVNSSLRTVDEAAYSEATSEPRTSLPTPSSIEGEAGGDVSNTSMEVLRMYAFKIAHAIPLLFEPESGAFGCNVSLFPLLSAWRFLAMTEPPGSRSPEHEIILGLFGREYQGTSVGRYVASLKREVWKSLGGEELR